MCDPSTPCPGYTSGCNWFHTGTDYDTNYRGLGASDSGTVVDIYNGSTGSTYPTISKGNYVIIKHDSTHYSLYYHLAHDSMTVGINDLVSAGENIAQSGNTGNTSGPHLHYVLMNCKCSNPKPSQTYAPNGKWTTSSGRVPWLNATAPNSSLAVDVCPYDTATYSIDFKNTGGRTWRTTNDTNGKGRVIIHATDADGSVFLSSQFAASDWETNSTPGVADDLAVAPDGTGTFTFGVRGIGTEGTTYTARFNLMAEDLRNFLYTETDFKISVLIVPHHAEEVWAHGCVRPCRVGA